MIERMVGDTGADIVEVGKGFDRMQFGRSPEGINNRSPPGAIV